MKFLLDENRSPRLATLLQRSGYEADHVVSFGLSRAPDSEILEFARETERILISGDSDFGLLLARGQLVVPSTILIRGHHLRDAMSQASVLLPNLEQWRIHLEPGALIVVARERFRIRRLPLTPGDI